MQPTALVVGSKSPPKNRGFSRRVNQKKGARLVAVPFPFGRRERGFVSPIEKRIGWWAIKFVMAM
jgi:hypothetical protein